MKLNKIQLFMKSKIFYIAFVASLGGLLFGFDTAVISGAEQAIEKIYALSSFRHGFTMSIALIGTFIGAFFSTRWKNTDGCRP